MDPSFPLPVPHSGTFFRIGQIVNFFPAITAREFGGKRVQAKSNSGSVLQAVQLRRDFPVQ